MGLLPAKGFHLGGLVLNRVLPAYLLSPGLAPRAARLSEEAEHLAGLLCTEKGPLRGIDPVLVERVLQEVGVNFNNLGVVARREASLRSELSGPPGVVVTVPELEQDVHDLEGVLALGRHIWS
jgi:hypothetical protein